jgi:murein DD-endopeptidase MepM/ murein hydrolase activator NlpD
MKSRSWLGKLMIGGGTTILLAGILLILISLFQVSSKPAAHLTTQQDSLTQITVPEPVAQPDRVLYGMVVNDLEVIEGHVRKNQRFTDLFKAHFVHDKVVRQLSALPRDVFDFRKVTASKKYTLLVKQDSVRTAKALIYEPNPIDYYIFHLEDSLTVEAGHRDTELVEKGIAGEVQESVSATIESLGVSPEVTNRFVDIFAWQVDFNRLQKGDRFKLIYKEIQVDGEFIGVASIEGIYFEHAGKSFYGFPLDQGDGMDFFDENGHSLRKAFLKYPIEFTRISSRFNLKRFHPVAKVFRAHRGTDFAAPVGTPIRSVGDGIVEEARYKSNNGNYVKIRHNGTYTTQYLHMSRIASGIKPGRKIKQGQTIGFVGSTGLATGPHLCYRFWKNGVQVDALRIKLPPAQPVSAENMSTFEMIKQELSQKLGMIPFPSTSGQITVASN